MTQSRYQETLTLRDGVEQVWTCGVLDLRGEWSLLPPNDGLKQEGRSAQPHLTTGSNKKAALAACLFEPPVGFEPTTPALQERCSGQLS
jgi:hypothetical protein